MARFSNSRSRPPTHGSNSAKPVMRRRLASGRNGRRSGLALSEFASRRVRRYLDPALLAEIVDDSVQILDGLAFVDLCARDHEHAIAAVRRKRRPRAVRRTRRNECEGETREGQDKKDEDDKEHTETTHIRRGLPPVLTLAGGLPNMTMLRAFFLAF